MTERIAYIILSALLTWAWGVFQYHKGWQDSHKWLYNLLNDLRKEE